ncbi:flavin reductase family protein [Microlunatus speluncae]|uniref:flavin reductase family protein n=1 Tax=Microlunatus speluncae TaxID=2594267 RepID=UPI00126639EE|nr:flavin reductase family protein [Microlunatus speluncae]
MSAHPAYGTRQPGISLVPAIPEPAVSPELYRSVFRLHAGGVAAITAAAGSAPVGFTATSVVSVSLNPPMVSFSLSNSASSFSVVDRASYAAINLLAADQSELAVRFATSGIDRFAHPTRWSTLADGTPVLDDAASLLHGRIAHRFAVGDHQIVVLRLLTAEVRRPYRPLVYHDGGYGALAGSGDLR